MPELKVIHVSKQCRAKKSINTEIPFCILVKHIVDAYLWAA